VEASVLFSQGYPAMWIEVLPMGDSGRQLALLHPSGCLWSQCPVTASAAVESCTCNLEVRGLRIKRVGLCPSTPDLCKMRPNSWSLARPISFLGQG